MARASDAASWPAWITVCQFGPPIFGAFSGTMTACPGRRDALNGSPAHQPSLLFFAEITERCVRRGSHASIQALEKAMLDYLDRRNRKPKPFVWKADADLILGKVQRLCKRIANSGT